MWTLMRIASLAALIVGITGAGARAHELPWPNGESRQMAYGHCAKGACSRRTSWSAGKPHRHVRGEVVLIEKRTAHDARARKTRGR